MAGPGTRPLTTAPPPVQLTNSATPTRKLHYHYSRAMAGGREQEITKEFIQKQLDEDELDLSMCNLSIVPVKQLAQFPRGTKLDLSHNRLTALPDDFFSLKHLVMLDLSRNQLSQLPKNFGQLVNLQKLILEGNRLTSLPLSFYHLNKLKWLDLKQNELDPELMEAVGHCLSEKECKDCAARVIPLMKRRSSDAEREKQRRLAEEREQRKREEEKMKLEQSRQKSLRQRQRALAAQQKREELERQREEEKSREEEELKEEEEEEEENEDAPENKPPARTSIFTSCLLLLPLILIVVYLVFGIFLSKLE